ncbi:MAG TPA: FUSC family protein [Xanthobacteraceae bacterium]
MPHFELRQGLVEVVPALFRYFRELLRTVSWAVPALLYGLRLWASVCLALYVAFFLELDNPFWAGTSAAIVCQPRLGASLRKGWYRMIGTLVGAVMSVVLVACFPQDRVLFLAGVALWGAACAFVATVLRNFASYSAALAGYTVAIVATDLLGATGGPDANAAFLTAVSRASEICIGIACAGIVLGLSDLGGAPRRLAAQFADLAAGITGGFVGELASAGPEPFERRTVRREFTRRVIALDPIIDESLGESSRLRYHSPVLQSAVDGLFAALAGWRSVGNHLVGLPGYAARREAAVILQSLPQELRSLPEHGEPRRWIADPTGLYRICETTMRRFISLPVSTPSLRLLADKAALAISGIMRALNGLALLVADPARPVPRGVVSLRVPDWLPALVNAGRAFIVIGTAALFWIVTAWPGGSETMLFAAIVVLLLSPNSDQAYAASIAFTVGILLDLGLTAFVDFAALPALATETFAAFALVIGLCLVPLGALLALARRPWQTGMFTGMTLIFVPLLAPTNPMTYNTLQFYNGALAIVAGAGTAALSFRLLPPLSPAFRTFRLLALTLRDLRRLATGRVLHDWEGRVYGRLSAMPNEATPLQRAQLAAALAVGHEIIRLRHVVRRLGLEAYFKPAMAAVAQGDCASATAHFARLDAALASRVGDRPLTETVLRARGSILALSETLAQHADFFSGGDH